MTAPLSRPSYSDYLSLPEKLTSEPICEPFHDSCQEPFHDSCQEPIHEPIQITFSQNHIAIDSSDLDQLDVSLISQISAQTNHPSNKVLLVVDTEIKEATLLPVVTFEEFKSWPAQKLDYYHIVVMCQFIEAVSIGHLNDFLDMIKDRSSLQIIFLCWQEQALFDGPFCLGAPQVIWHTPFLNYYLYEKRFIGSLNLARYEPVEDYFLRYRPSEIIVWGAHLGDNIETAQRGLSPLMIINFLTYHFSTRIRYIDPAASDSLDQYDDLRYVAFNLPRELAIGFIDFHQVNCVYIGTNTTTENVELLIKRFLIKSQDLETHFIFDGYTRFNRVIQAITFLEKHGYTINNVYPVTTCLPTIESHYRIKEWKRKEGHLYLAKITE